MIVIIIVHLLVVQPQKRVIQCRAVYTVSPNLQMKGSSEQHMYFQTWWCANAHSKLVCMTMNISLTVESVSMGYREGKCIVQPQNDHTVTRELSLLETGRD